ncbi:hypothetical protein FQR65_LT04563 [Abscondita terminalis]|nr:hypothetical protein FQR65_LT04563 [Abscondita terminalis]
MAGHWERSSFGRPVPHNAIHAGHDVDGSSIYAGKAHFHGDSLPCKIIPQRREAYVAYNGREHRVTDFEYLCEKRMTWVHSSNGHVPAGAVPAGKTSSGETLYIGRVHHCNTVTVGKVHPSHRCLYIPYGGNEVILIVGYTWVPSSPGRSAPPNSMHAGHDADGSAIYAGRAYFNGDTVPCKIIPQRRQAYVCHGGKEHPVSNFDYLCEQRMIWVHSSNGHVPHGAVQAGRTRSGETLYLGRVHHANSVTVGKVHPSHGCLYIPFGGNEIRHTSYEILVLQ